MQRAHQKTTCAGVSASSSSSALHAEPSVDAFAFRRHVSTLYLRNQLSGLETAHLVRSAKSSGASGVADLSRAGASGAHPGNSSRDLLTSLMKGNKSPAPYWVEIPVSDPKKPGKQCKALVPVLLMHEMFHFVLEGVALASVVAFEGAGLESKRKKFAADYNLDHRKVVPIGLHGDGVPHKAKGRGSVEVMSWSFAAQPCWERVLFACLDKVYMCSCGCGGRCTLDALLRVFLWSLQILFAGSWPTCRHDGSAWHRSDSSRAGLSGGLGVHAALMQVRGDWAYYKQLFSLKGWASNSICWRCLANKGDLSYKDNSAGAHWRKTRYTNTELYDRLADEGAALSPIFSAPGFDPCYITVDVLHALDLGCTADALGNLMTEALSHYFVGTKANRLSSLWRLLQEYYKECPCESRLDKLTAEMIRSTAKKSKPKLRCKGAECRYLAPFGVRLAQLLHAKSPTDRNMTIVQTFSALFDFYMSMSVEPFSPGVSGRAIRKFLVLYGSLGASSPDPDIFWVMKPKFHLLAELEYQCADLSNPRHFWCYRDESFVGFVAEFAASRGGGHSAATLPERTLTKYRLLSARH